MKEKSDEARRRCPHILTKNTPMNECLTCPRWFWQLSKNTKTSVLNLCSWNFKEKQRCEIRKRCSKNSTTIIQRVRFSCWRKKIRKRVNCSENWMYCFGLEWKELELRTVKQNTRSEVKQSAWRKVLTGTDLTFAPPPYPAHPRDFFPNMQKASTLDIE